MTQDSKLTLAHDPQLRLSLTWAAVLTAINLLLSLFYYFRLPAQIPLFYCRIYGLYQLANKQFIFLLPGLSLVSFALLLALVSRSLKFALVFARLLGWFALLLSILYLISLIHILVLVL